MITRDEVMSRVAMAPWVPNTVEYDMDVSPEFPTGADCSAYVTWCWGVKGDYNTVTLVSSGLMTEIPFSDVQRGDAMGHCGPNTGGANGHIQLFDRWENLNAGTYWCWQQNGVGLGPHYDLEKLPSNYRAYRFRDISDAPGTPGNDGSEDEMKIFRVKDPDGGIWIQDGVDRASGKPILWPVHNPGAWEEYSVGFGLQVTREVDGIDWRWWTNGDTLIRPDAPGQSPSVVPDHTHVPGDVSRSSGK